MLKGHFQIASGVFVIAITVAVAAMGGSPSALGLIVVGAWLVLRGAGEVEP